jgi:hypothetical protein
VHDSGVDSVRLVTTDDLDAAWSAFHDATHRG